MLPFSRIDDNSNYNNSHSKNKLKGYNLKSSIYLKKIKNMYVNDNNIYKSLCFLLSIKFFEIWLKLFVKYIYIYFNFLKDIWNLEKNIK